ncbi:MAG TPA: metalloregulator ArsR/SmtB family transcription factor [Actinomycetota bacterium]|nr:metalloregulator ArsR/SmtB family transcription factor [Actinomycetota bacterium]
MAIREIAVIDERCCVPLASAPLSETDAERLASGLRVVAEPTRLRLLSMISAAGESCVCDLTQPLGLSQPTVSHHLKVLTEAGLLTREQRGRWAFFRLQPRGLGLLRDALSPGAGPRPL